MRWHSKGRGSDADTSDLQSPPVTADGGTGEQIQGTARARSHHVTPETHSDNLPKLRRTQAGLATVVLRSVGVVATASPAFATICNVGQAHVGWATNAYNGSQPPGGIEGSSSYIYTRSTDAFCSTIVFNGQSNSTSWNMVFANGNLGDYAQAGTYAGVGTVCPKAWSEQSLNGSYADFFVGGGSGTCLTIGSRHAYRNLMVLQGNGTYRMTSSYDGVPIHTTSYDRFANWPLPLGIQFEGATQYNGTDIPGDATTKENFTSMGAQLFSDSLVTTCGNAHMSRVNEASTLFDTSATNCSNVNTWTK